MQIGASARTPTLIGLVRLTDRPPLRYFSLALRTRLHPYTHGGITNPISFDLLMQWSPTGLVGRIRVGRSCLKKTRHGRFRHAPRHTKCPALSNFATCPPHKPVPKYAVMNRAGLVWAQRAGKLITSKSMQAEMLQVLGASQSLSQFYMG